MKPWRVPRPAFLASFVAVSTFVLPSAAGLAQPQASDPPVLDVEFMLRGYFFAGSRIEDPEALGGFGPSGNLSQSLDGHLEKGADSISLFALPEVSAPFREGFAGFRVVLVNTTDQVQSFEASDSRLPIVRQAMTEQGDWKAIEYLPSSWCGNSSHRVFLERDHYWSFTAPVYDGPIQTKMRFALLREHSEPIYSNEFGGRINPGQFTDKQGHTPTGIMDPYND